MSASAEGKWVGIGLVALLLFQVALVGLRVAGPDLSEVGAWPWWKVLLPVSAMAVIIGGIFVVVGSLLGVMWVVGKLTAHKDPKPPKS